MTAVHYINQVLSPKSTVSGTDVPAELRSAVIDGLRSVVDGKDELLSSMDQKVADLQREVIRLQRMLFGRRSEKKPKVYPGQLSLDFGEEFEVTPTDDDLAAMEHEVKEVVEEVNQEAVCRRKRAKKQSSRKGSSYKLYGVEHVGSDHVVYPQGYTPETMIVVGYTTYQRLEHVPAKLLVVEEVHAVCKSIESKPTDAETEFYEAPAPQNCLPGCGAGNSLMAAIITDKFCDHIPEHRQVQRFKSLGATIPKSSINRWVHDLADILFPIYQQQMRLVLNSRYQHWDESTISILDALGHARKGYIWAIVDGLMEVGLCFLYEKGSRGSKVLTTRVVGNKEVAVQSDGFVAYSILEKLEHEKVRTLYCMAHARRKFESIQNDYPEARHVMEYIEVLYTIEKNLQDSKADADTVRSERQRLSLPILKLINCMLKKYSQKELPKHPLTLACNYALERWDGLCAYCDDGAYSIDNNEVERVFKSLATGRKNWLFVANNESAEDTAVYLTLVGSCKLLGIQPYKYFMDILPRLHSNMTEEEYEQLLPIKVKERLH